MRIVVKEKPRYNTKKNFPKFHWLPMKLQVKDSRHSEIRFLTWSMIQRRWNDWNWSNEYFVDDVDQEYPKSYLYLKKVVQFPKTFIVYLWLLIKLRSKNK